MERRHGNSSDSSGQRTERQLPSKKRRRVSFAAEPLVVSFGEADAVGKCPLSPLSPGEGSGSDVLRKKHG